MIKRGLINISPWLMTLISFFPHQESGISMVKHQKNSLVDNCYTITIRHHSSSILIWNSQDVVVNSTIEHYLWTSFPLLINQQPLLTPLFIHQLHWLQFFRALFLARSADIGPAGSTTRRVSADLHAFLPRWPAARAATYESAAGWWDQWWEILVVIPVVNG